MPREYDSQLMESVGVRRRRLRDATLFGAERSRRSMDEYVGKAFGGIALAAVICAGCVGWAFVSREMAKPNQQQPPIPGVTASVEPSATPSGSADTSPRPGESPTQATSSATR